MLTRALVSNPMKTARFWIEPHPLKFDRVDAPRLGTRCQDALYSVVRIADVVRKVTQSLSVTSPATSLTSRQANRKRRELVDALKTSLVNLRNVRMFAPNDPDLETLKNKHSSENR